MFLSSENNAIIYKGMSFSQFVELFLELFTPTCLIFQDAFWSMG